MTAHVMNRDEFIAAVQAWHPHATVTLADRGVAIWTPRYAARHIEAFAERLGLTLGTLNDPGGAYVTVRVFGFQRTPRTPIGDAS